MKKHKHAALRVSGNHEEVDRFLKTEIIKIGDFLVMLTVTDLLPEVKEYMNYRRKCFFIPGYKNSIVGKIHEQVIHYDTELINKISITGQCYEIDTFGICENSIKIIEQNKSQILIAFEFWFSGLWIDLLRAEYPKIGINIDSVKLDSKIHGRRRQVIYNHGRINDELEYPDVPENEIF